MTRPKARMWWLVIETPSNPFWGTILIVRSRSEARNHQKRWGGNTVIRCVTELHPRKKARRG